MSCKTSTARNLNIMIIVFSGQKFFFVLEESPSGLYDRSIANCKFIFINLVTHILLHEELQTILCCNNFIVFDASSHARLFEGLGLLAFMYKLQYSLEI